MNYSNKIVNVSHSTYESCDLSHILCALFGRRTLVKNQVWWPFSVYRVLPISLVVSQYVYAYSNRTVSETISFDHRV